MATVNIGNLTFTHKGDYSSSTAYVKNDVVYYATNGIAYIAKQATQGNVPTSTAHWNVFVQKGTDGTDADLAAISGTVQGDIYYNNGSSIARLAPGTASQLLQTGGASANPSWTNAPVGIAEADMYRKTSNTGASAQDPVTSWERCDDASFAKIGTGMTVTSNIFIFPSTGLYFIRFSWDGDSANQGGHCRIAVSSDGGSNYDVVADPHVGEDSGYYIGSSTEAFVNVTNATNFRVKFVKSGVWNMYGSTNENRTMVTFIRLGASQ